MLSASAFQYGMHAARELSAITSVDVIPTATRSHCTHICTHMYTRCIYMHIIRPYCVNSTVQCVACIRRESKCIGCGFWIKNVPRFGLIAQMDEKNNAPLAHTPIALFRREVMTCRHGMCAWMHFWQRGNLSVSMSVEYVTSRLVGNAMWKCEKAARSSRRSVENLGFSGYCFIKLKILVVTFIAQDRSLNVLKYHPRLYCVENYGCPRKFQYITEQDYPWAYENQKYKKFKIY